MNAREKLLYDRFIEELAREGTLPKELWPSAAQGRLEVYLAAEVREEPLKIVLGELREIGVSANSLYELDTPEITESVMKVILRHVRLDYCDNNLDTILGVVFRAKGFEDQIMETLIAKFQSLQSPSIAKETIGFIFGRKAKKHHLDQLLRLLEDRNHGTGLCGVVEAVARLMKQDAAPILIGLLDREEILNFVVKALGKTKSSEAIEALDPFLKHPDSYTRSEAKKALKKCLDARDK